MRRRRGLAVAAVLAATAHLPPLASPLAAQELRVRVEDAAGRAVAGARLHLLSADGARTAAQATSGERGDGRLAAPAAGRYRVLALRIGFLPDTSETVALDAGASRALVLRLQERRVRLDAVRITSGRRCHLRSEPGDLVTVWTQIRTALELSAAGREADAAPIQAQRYVRRIDAAGRIVADSALPPELTRARPFVSAPAATLSALGWVQVRGSEQVWYAPDEASLLSEEFARDHCYRIVRDEARRPGDVGLRFDPAPDRRYPEVAGTLWLDGTTAELREIAYAYVNVPLPGRAPLAGGEVRFARLPDGRWIASAWAVRMPRWYDAPANREATLAWYQEEGGVAAPYEGALYDLAAAPPGEVGGEVRDAAGRPLSGATLWLRRLDGADPPPEPLLLAALEPAPVPDDALAALGAPAPGQRAVTDPEGRFLVGALRPGRYRVTAGHPELDSLGSRLLAADVDVLSGERARVALAAPGREPAARRCASADGARGTITGVVADDSSGLAVRGAVVLASWLVIETGPDGLPRSRREARQAETDERGAYLLCGLETESELELQAFAGRVATDAVPLTLGERAFAVRSFVVGRDPLVARAAERQDVDGAPAEATPPAAAPDAGPTAAVRGLVLGADGAPISRAVVRLGDQETATDSGGRFVLGGLIPRTARLEVRALGLQPAARAVPLRGGDTAVAVVRLARTVATLDAVAITRRRLPLPPSWVDAARLRARRSGDRGSHIEYPELKRATTLTELLGMQRGVTVLHLSNGRVPSTVATPPRFDLTVSPAFVVTLPRVSGNQSQCIARVQIDGRESDWSEITAYQPRHFYHVEVYARRAFMPNELSGQAFYDCGIVAFWTDLGYRPPAEDSAGGDPGIDGLPSQRAPGQPAPPPAAASPAPPPSVPAMPPAPPPARPAPGPPARSAGRA